LLLNQFPLLVGQFSPGHAPESSTAFLGFEMSSSAIPFDPYRVRDQICHLIVASPIKAYTFEATVYPIIKRLLDMLLVILTLPLILPIALGSAIAIYLETGGPILSRTAAIGKAGRPITLYKFRTMHPVSDSEHEAFLAKITSGAPRGADGDFVPKLFRDPRITGVGRILRRTFVDEMPLLVNVVRGDMSLIGPRPTYPFEWDKYPQWAKERVAVLPGITGLAAVNSRRGISLDETLKWDIEYVRHQSFALDLKILAKTVEVVLTGENASTV
jgi:lipopolysaccharide/colanic/teichoic acid biosynthesis glycosyltransferase